MHSLITNGKEWWIALMGIQHCQKHYYFSFLFGGRNGGLPWVNEMGKTGHIWLLLNNNEKTIVPVQVKEKWLIIYQMNDKAHNCIRFFKLMPSFSLKLWNFILIFKFSFLTLKLHINLQEYFLDKIKVLKKSLALKIYYMSTF